MKIYNIAAFMLMVNLSIALLGGMGLVNANIATEDITEGRFHDEVPEEIVYSDADIGLYLFGDILRAMNMIGKAFYCAPTMLSSLMSEVGIPAAITNMFMVLTWFVYLAGVAQVIGKFSLRNGA